MSLSPAFGSQVAAIMDVLAKAAVAEISKLVEDGTVVLRLEMCRKDNEIQELKRSLKLMEVELCNAREAVMSRTSPDKQDQATVATQVAFIDELEGEQTHGGYVAPKTAESLRRDGRGAADRDDQMKPAVKREPAESLDVQETMEDAAAAAAAAAASVCFETGSELLWPPTTAAACSAFEKSPTQQHVQMFPAHAEPFSAHRNTECSYGAMSAATETPGDSLSLQIKAEAELRPVCAGGGASDPSRRVSYPPLAEDRCLPPAPQPPGPAALVIPQVQRSTAASDDPALARTNLRAKRFLSVWRANQRLFACPVCGKGFPRLSQLEEHRAAHQPLKPFRCLECGKSFTQKTRLKTHQSVHTGERPFSCSICGKMFSRQDNCTRHERFHSGLKPYSCGQCGRSFTVLANLKIHQEIHLQGR